MAVGAAQVKFLLYILLEQVLLPAAAENKVQDSILGRCQPSHTLSAVNLAPDQVGKVAIRRTVGLTAMEFTSFIICRKTKEFSVSHLTILRQPIRSVNQIHTIVTAPAPGRTGPVRFRRVPLI